MACLASGAAISARYLLLNADHCAGDTAAWASFMVATLGARVGNHTSNQFCFENCALGTPRGGRRTVPILVPSRGRRAVPRRTTLTLMRNSYPRILTEPQSSDKTCGPDSYSPDRE